jgi:hypothetical protein
MTAATCVACAVGSFTNLNARSSCTSYSCPSFNRFPAATGQTSAVCVNDAPQLAGGSVALVDVAEDTVDPAGKLVSEFGLSDDTNEVGHLQLDVTALQTTLGRWERGNSGNWVTLSLGSRVASDSGHRIRFVPNANANGVATLTFRAFDSLIFSSGTATVSVSVVAVADAPELSGNPAVTFTQIASTFPLASNNGFSVSSFFASKVSDVDTSANALFVRITGTTGAFGTWQSRIGSTSAWTNVVGVALQNGQGDVLPLDPALEASIRFVPTNGAHGSASLTWVATDGALFSSSSSTASLEVVDTTPPTITPAVDSVESNSAGTSVAISEAGKVYYAVLPSPSTAPDISVLRGGAFVSAATASTVPLPLSGLRAETQYDVYLLSEDALGNVAAAAVTQQFTTTGCSGYQVYHSLCNCPIPTYNNITDHPLQLDVGETGLFNDRLRIVYRESLKYYDTVAVFGSSLPAACANLVQWTSSEDVACTRKWIGEIAWNKAFNASVGAQDCKIVRDATALNGDVVFTVDFSVRNKETLNPVRGTVTPRSLEHKMPFQIVFPTSVSVSSGAVDVFAPVLTLGAVVRQAVVHAPGTTPTAEVEVFSSVQWPFIFSAASWSEVPTFATGAVPVDTPRAGYACVDGTDKFTGPVCEQLWASTLTLGANQCKLDGTYEMQFNIACRAQRANDCPLDVATNTAKFRFALQSSYFCAQVVDEIGLGATMQSYLDVARTTPKDDFLDTQVAYFSVPVTSNKASIFRTALWELSIVKTELGSSTVLLTHDLMNGGANTALGDSYELADSFGDAAAVGAESIVLFQLVIKTGASHLNLAQDQIVEVTLTATVRVQYENAGQISIVSNDEFVSMRGFVGELAAVGVASSSVKHSLAATGGAREGPSSSSSSSSVSAASGVSAPAFVGIVVAAAALIVVVAMVAVARVRRASSVAAVVVESPTTTQLATLPAVVGEKDDEIREEECVRGTIVDGMSMRELLAVYVEGGDTE